MNEAEARARRDAENEMADRLEELTLALSEMVRRLRAGEETEVYICTRWVLSKAATACEPVYDTHKKLPYAREYHQVEDYYRQVVAEQLLRKAREIQ